MSILALDTSTLVSSVALAQPGQLLAEITLQTKKTHSEHLMPHIADLLVKASQTRADLTAIAVSIGPGSFTGLRIGLATAKALAYALKLPLLGVPTLAALAYGCYAPQVTLAPMLDAQKGNVYYSLYQWRQDGFSELAPPAVAAAESLFLQLERLETPVVLLGEAAVMFAGQAAAYRHLSLPPAHCVISRAGSVAMLGLDRLARGQRDDIEALEPLYIRRSEAEVLWEARHGGGCE
ncbi:MAG: tRNA (adenosine(37)-N6)-threonylcarbamoyltransferase complex dimerization subunit type 1 TsaB [Sporomusaceae bacterium]|nr:tRNA (adenosine(37)-N6)-threonylcarbamoyltransferase complex dimerization subunit type 1 TsaB [Sporomusaceae bacterium]